MDICEKNIFKKIYYQWNSPLQRFMQSKGLDMATSTDLVQEIFIRLWKNCAKVSVEKSKNFLFKAAKNIVIDDSVWSM